MGTLVAMAQFRLFVICDVFQPLVLQSQLGLELTGNCINVLKSRRDCAVL